VNEEPVSRREFDKLDARVAAIDAGGSRGVVVVQERLIELSKEVARLDEQVKFRFEAHDKQHSDEKRDHVSGRRWLITTGIAGVIAMVTIIALLVDVVRHVHG